MPHRLPPLTALRAFEAAARHLSFAKAADELNVTPAALSFQIRNLEDHLGQPLFRRRNRAVDLTEAGRTLAPGTTEGFAALQSAWAATRRLGDTTRLVVTAGPAFTAKWLAPRLFQFVGANPDIELRFSASLRIMDFARDEIDVAIRFGQEVEAGLFSRVLVEEWVTPMVAPDLAAGLATPADLARLPLLHQDDLDFLRPRANWAAWFAAAGLSPPPDTGPHFSQADHAVTAALAGAGAILGRPSLTEGHLQQGQLVMPFELTLGVSAVYRFVCPMGAETRPQVARFLAWLEAELDGLRAIIAARRPG
ncbi:MAG: LysR family transcriptional regulator, glycine cleavage system transcriptional activator [Rhodobacteraceae bacterium HLUCCA08]|nr:MAG: LysR family transcriptional regulator, glycine cleavage system transcriptional activator [Rhodobacteraceae bacterium HLUCCA08]